METIREPVRNKPKRWKKISLIGFISFLVIVISLLIFVTVYINRTLPTINGQLTLEGLKESVEVVRDDMGVPHIKAANDHDLYLAQGYITAQDRLFQMDLSRRQASGTLSEVVGSATINQDKYFRTLGLRRAAEKSYSGYEDSSKQILQWYADGVNAYMRQAAKEHRLPVEFRLMGYSPKPWTPIDSLTIGKYMAFDLGGHWETQAFDYYLLNNFPKQQAYELFPSYPDNAPTIIKDNEVVNVASSFQEAVIPHAFNGSNDWVVSGKKSASGKPILSDDPHLSLATPSIWYQAHLESPTVNVSGVIFAGIPGIILGHNEHIAWGVTNTGPDVQQLYLEKRNPENPNQFLYEGNWENATVIKEPIKVKDQPTIDYQVVETKHGPIVSEFAEDSGKNTVMSLRWTALDPSTELEAVLDINRASNWQEFEKGLEKFLVPTQNFVFASDQGTIAYKANGKIPIYKDGKDALLPLEGWKKENEWQGYIPFDELPRVVNPEKGFIATANNKVVTDKYPYHISNVWAQPYRYERIEEVLAKSENLTVEDMMNLQMDQLDLQAREFLPIFLNAIDKANLSSTEKKVITLLESWNYQDGKDAPQPLVFQKWLNEISSQLYKDKISEGMMKLFNGQGQITDQLIRHATNGETVTWIEEQGGLSNLLTNSFKNAITNISKDLGDDPKAWKWGEFHRVQFKHPLSSISFLDYFFNHEDPIPVGGSRITVMAASYSNETGIVNHGASWRFVVDTNDLSHAYHIVGPGQSGNFKSKWYHNQMTDWVEGNYHKTEIINYQGEKLILKP